MTTPEDRREYLAGIGVNAAPEEFFQALEGLDYPASKAAIVRKSRDRGGIDWEVPAALEALPDRTYESEADLFAELRALYDQGFVPFRTGGPAAEFRGHSTPPSPQA